MSGRQERIKEAVRSTLTHVEESLKLKPTIYGLGFRNGLALANHALQGLPGTFKPWEPEQVGLGEQKNPEPKSE